jgi:hypothetical protein
MPNKTIGTHIMENLDMLFVAQLVLFTLFISHVGKLFIHLLINTENETK